ncbi:XdhC family protein [Marinobacter sp. VGCF2001]|uniref:XdhC family protein n=1 Tax=Marinobacter sp. VGCF2001 TaxID=3417189 RepID=UPI003CF7A56A
MSGLVSLLEAIENQERAGEEFVLATVVKVEGSAYRRPGARMLISSLGQSEGTVSGGCLEQDVIRKAFWLTSDGPTVRSYSTDEEGEASDSSYHFALGCDGKVHLLFERIAASAPSHLVRTLKQVKARRQPAVIATVISAPADADVTVGQRLTLNPDGEVDGQLPSGAVRQAIVADMQSVMASGRSLLRRYADPDIEVFVEWLAPPQRLVVFGAGHDAQPLVKVAKMQGWQVAVIDGRANFAVPARFPEADEVRALGVDEPFSPADLLEGAAVVILTHSLEQDKHWLSRALNSGAIYVGQLGPRYRTERLLAEMDEHSRSLSALEKLHYPVGLDLGGDTPESVAVAIVAEISAVLNGRNGGPLALRRGGIHSA